MSFEDLKFGENAIKQKQELNEASVLESRLFEEIRSKEINIFSEPDIKLKDTYTPENLFQMSLSGMVPSNRLVFENEEAELKITPGRLKDNYRNLEKNNVNAKKGNVYYPEALLHVLKEVVDLLKEHKNLSFVDSEATYRYFEKDPEIIRKNRLDAVRTITFGTPFFKLLTKNVHSLSIADEKKEEISSILDLIHSSFMYLGSSKFELSDEKVVLLSDFLSNQENFSALREVWMKTFFELGKTRSSYGPQAHGHVFKQGFIIKPEVEARYSYDPDYPSQATVTNFRVKPEDFIGLMFNPDFKNIGSYQLVRGEARFAKYVEPISSRAIELVAIAREADVMGGKYPGGLASDLQEKRHIPDLDILSFLKEFAFKMPDDPVSFALDVASYDFGRWLINKGYSTEEKVRNLVQTHAAQRDPRSLESLSEYAREFITEFSPLKDGELLWNGMIRIAKRLKIPIYDTNGNVLWPEK